MEDGLRLKHKNEFLSEKLEKVDAVSDFVFQFSFKVVFLSFNVVVFCKKMLFREKSKEKTN
jgi:hypothetical protein